jgi:hypothetical protein
MPLPSYSDVFNLDHERPHPEDIHEGDVVRMGNNFHPHYAVIAVHGEKAWVRNLQSGEDCLAQLSRCRRLELAKAA